jgi:hypothetical protein
MSVDIEGLRDTILGVESEIDQLTKLMGHLGEHVARLKQIVDDADGGLEHVETVRSEPATPPEQL